MGMVSTFHIPSFNQDKKLNIGLIGCGWYGLVITKAALEVGGVNIGSRPKEFKDYQDLMDAKGLDIYCEKPLAYDVKEGEAMVRAAELAGNMVQIGFQRRQSDSYKKTKELIEGGKIGKPGVDQHLN